MVGAIYAPSLSVLQSQCSDVVSKACKLHLCYIPVLSNTVQRTNKNPICILFKIFTSFNSRSKVYLIPVVCVVSG